MTPKISHITAVAAAAFALAAPAAWGGPYPDAFERAVSARETGRSGLASMPDAFERAVLASQRGPGRAVPADAHGRAALAGDRGQPAVSTYPDAFERHAYAGSTLRVVSDSHQRATPASTPVAGPVSTGRDIEWPQIAIGFGIGVLLSLALMTALRLGRTRPLAH